MVKHLREHVIGMPSNSSSASGKKRGRGRPRQTPMKVSDTPKRGRGRPRKSLTNPFESTGISTPQGQKRKKPDDETGDDNHDIDDLEDSDIDAAAEKIEAAELDDQDVDRDYSPVTELTDSGRRVQPRRSRKGRNSWLRENYVMIRVGNKVKLMDREEGGADVEEADEGSEKQASVTPVSKVLTNEGEKVKSVKKGPGRPRKIKELVDNALSKLGVVGFSERRESIGTAVDKTDDHETGKVDGGNTGDETVGTDVTGVKPSGLVSVPTSESDVGTEPKPDVNQIETAEQDISENKEGELSQVPENNTDAPNDAGNDGSMEVGQTVKENVVLMFDQSTDEMYGCVLCGEKFREEMEAVSHFMSHSRGSDKYKTAANSTDDIQASTDNNGETSEVDNSLKFPCDICQQSFKSAQYLYRHMIMHTDIFSCVQCKKPFSRKDSLQKHVLKCCPHLAENYKIFSCVMCSRVFSTRAGQKKHLEKCEAVPCPDCMKVFSCSDDLASHTCRKGDNDDILVGKFSCGVCPKTFQSMYYLKQHTLLHKKLHSCSGCGKSLPSEEELEEHKILCLTLTSIKVLGIGKCDKCDMEFKFAKAFREHHLSHTHPYQCEKCLRRFVKVGTLSSHDCQSASDDYVCTVCSKNFKSQVNLERHVKETGCMKYGCSECDMQFNTKTHARNHQCAENPEAKVIPIQDTKEVCDTCGKSFSTKSNLTKHMLLHGAKLYACPHCTKRFHIDAYLKDHISSVHYNIFKYQCTQCGKMLKSKTGLIAHTKISHSTVVESHPCQKCGKVFKQKGNLRTHMFSHNTEKKFSCTDCPRSFKYPDQLSRHKIEHTQVDKLRCLECDKTFFRAYEMKKHMQIYHSGYVYVCGICTSRCGHRHTLVRHYKRKHPEDYSMLSQEGYVDSLLKHVSDIYPNNVATQGITVQTSDLSLPGQEASMQGPDMAVSQGLTFRTHNIIFRNPVTGEENEQVHEVTTPEMLSRDAAEALRSLAMGTVTAKQYLLLKDKGLFGDAVSSTGMPSDEVNMEAGTSVDSEGNEMMQSQEGLQQEQVISDGVANLASMDPSLNVVQNKDGTISIGGIQGIPQTLEGMENNEGQVVILQIVDSDGQEVSGLMQGEIIHQLQTGGILQANQEIIHLNEAKTREQIEDNGETEAVKQEVDAFEEDEMNRDELADNMHVDHEITTVTVEQSNNVQGEIIQSTACGNTMLDTNSTETAIQYLQHADEHYEQSTITEHSVNEVVTVGEITETAVSSEDQAASDMIEDSNVIHDHMTDNMQANNEDMTEVAGEHVEIGGN